MSRGVQGLVMAMAVLGLAGFQQSGDTVMLKGSGGPPPPPPPVGADGGSNSVTPGLYGADGPTGPAGSTGMSVRPPNGPAVLAWVPVSPLPPTTSAGVAVPRACVAMSSDGRVTAAERPQWSQLNCAQYYP